MPHYQDGSPAAVGDVVKGRGYNVKGADGQLAEIVGRVVDIVPGSDSCNIRVAHVILGESQKPDPEAKLPAVSGAQIIASMNDGTLRPVALDIEYGQCDHFLKIIPAVLALSLFLAFGGVSLAQEAAAPRIDAITAIDGGHGATEAISADSAASELTTDNCVECQFAGEHVSHQGRPVRRFVRATGAKIVHGAKAVGKRARRAVGRALRFAAAPVRALRRCR